VIALAQGGALETVIPGLTGAFFDEPTAEALAETIAAFRPQRYDPHLARRNAARFAPEAFRERLRQAVEAGSP
jgi:glycosyltransferase involved in cell wall biosynthesis